ncbi:MAG: WXG100 family type VII secretion target [Ruminococcaceae bacterium]|nr:WXG100 family type VII secretion target [Oscillospiraceae bacterium]
MATSFSKVTTEELDRVKAQLDEKITAYNTAWNKLYSEIEDLRASKWQGIASDTFNTKLDGYRNDFQNLEEAMKRFSEHLMTASQKHSANEDDITSGASSLPVGN